jgi:alpha-mannosidase
MSESSVSSPALLHLTYGTYHITVEFDPGCEAMVYDLSGTPLQGITGGHDGDRRVDHIIPPSAVRAGLYEIVIESSCNAMFGTAGVGPPDENRYYTLASADLVVPNQEAWRLLWDYTTLRELSDNLPGNTTTQNLALVLQNKIMNTFNVADPTTIGKCRKIAEELFGEGWEAKGSGIYDKNVDAAVWGIGCEFFDADRFVSNNTLDCHIDTAWLWPYSV